MTLQEFSTEFDILYNNISSNQAPGLTEYEKSVFLTQAQEALVLDLYKGITGDSFETTEEVTRYLSSLVKSNKVTKFDTPVNNIGVEEYNINLDNLKDLLFITYQSASISVNLVNRNALVVPAKQDSLYRDLKNPFRGPNENKVLATSEGNEIKLYSKYPIINYNIKYLSKPTPIILEKLKGDLTIDGVSDSTECRLPEILHKNILLRAIQLAKAVWA